MLLFPLHFDYCLIITNREVCTILKFNMDAGNVTALEVILFFFCSTLEKFFNLIGIECNFHISIYVHNFHIYTFCLQGGIRLLIKGDFKDFDQI